MYKLALLFLQDMIEQNVTWNDDIGEWQLRCVAYSGNNMRKQSPQPDKDKEKVGITAETDYSWDRLQLRLMTAQTENSSDR